jgi:hypothetical protein
MALNAWEAAAAESRSDLWAAVLLSAVVGDHSTVLPWVVCSDRVALRAFPQAL